MVRTLTEDDVRAALAGVCDPEIPTVSIVDLGIVERVAIDGATVEVDLLPTFAGCPALDVIRDDVEGTMRALGLEARVRFVTTPPWTTERLTDTGREALRGFGIAPPVLRIGRKPAPVACPYCGATSTVEDSAFGPTLCRSIRYCPSCRNPFEAFKQKG